MKTILIGGCSFSQKMYHNAEQKLDVPWESWTDMLEEQHGQIKLHNTAKSSYSNQQIAKVVTEKLINIDFKVDHVFVQWSAIGRGYSQNEQHFFEKVVQQGEWKFAPYIEQYIHPEEMDGFCTSLTNQVSDEYYSYSLTQMILLKSFLEIHNIPYTFWWGWEQIDATIESKFPNLISKAYDGNWWMPKQHYSMGSLIEDKFGEDGFLPEDMHPNTQGQKYFYDNVINPIVNEKILANVRRTH